MLLNFLQRPGEMFYTQLGSSIKHLMIYFYMDTQDHAIYSLDPFLSYLLIPEEIRKTFGLSWNQTRVLLLHKQLF